MNGLFPNHFYQGFSPSSKFEFGTFHRKLSTRGYKPITDISASFHIQPYHKVPLNTKTQKQYEMMIYIFCRSYQHPQVPIQMSAATASTASNQQQQNDIPDYCNLPQPRQQSSIGEFIQTFSNLLLLCVLLKGTKKTLNIEVESLLLLIILNFLLNLRW